MPKDKIIIDGSNLSIGQVYNIVYRDNFYIELAESAKKQVQLSHDLLNQTLKGRVNSIIYGINTGFGPMASHILSDQNLLQLQENLIFSHASGMGEPIADKFVRASMVVRLNTLAKGYSGVSVELLERLAFLINKKVYPIIPEHGAVGTSGDLVQLAHIALALLGKGEINYKNTRGKTSSLFKTLGIKPYKLKAKEGLSLINGTSVMSGIGSLLVVDAEKLMNISVRAGALALELVHGFSDSISAELHNTRPHPGQKEIALRLRTLLKDSKRLRDRESLQKPAEQRQAVEEINESVQEVYSLRCIAQILGPVIDSLRKTQQEIETEINSATDNPIIDVKTKKFLHGGNFHGEYVAASLDQLKAGLVKMTMLAERQINFFLNRNINKTFPYFLNLRQPGLTLGLQGLQFVATSTAAYSQSLGYPHHLHSISTNGDNQDVVSMGTDAALIAHKVVENAYIVLAVEMVTLCQAVDVLKIKNQLSRSSKNLYGAVRSVFPTITEDRFMSGELKKLTDLLKTGEEFKVALK